MSNRREVLAGIAAGTAAIVGTTLGTPGKAFAADDSCDPCESSLGGPNAHYFPNVIVHTHENEKSLFYDDLLRGKIVMINCMSIKNDDVYPVTANLVKVQRMLGSRVGRDIFMYSMTVEPEHDTTYALRRFAEKHGVLPGWKFLTAEPEVVETLRGRLFSHSSGQAHRASHSAHLLSGSPQVQDCSMGLVRYGNEAVGMWGAVPAKMSPEWIVKRLSWVTPKPQPTGKPKRRGPAPVAWTHTQSRIEDNA